MKKTKILITGSNGLLGQKLVSLLAQKTDIQLIATSRGANRLLLDIQGKKWLTNWLDFRNLLATKQNSSYREVQSSCMPI